MSRIKSVWMAVIVCAAGVLCVANAAPPALDDAAAPITLGQWHASLEKAKAYSEENDIPLLYIWGYDNCSKCAEMDTYIARQAFIDWQTDRKLVMAYFKQNDINSSPEKNFAKYGLNGTLNLYPFVAVYWPSKNSKPYNFTGRYSGGNEELKFIAAIEAYIAEYVSEPVVPPAQDEWDPDDDVFLGANALDPSANCQAHGPHLLNVNDNSDWFLIDNMEAGKEYRVWITGYTAEGAADLRADFYLSPTNSPTATVPLADLQGGQNFAGGNPLFVNIARAADTNALAGYTINVCEWVPCTLSLTAEAVAVTAGTALNVEVRRSGENKATSATLTMVSGTAEAGQDFNGAPVIVNFPAGGSDVRSASIPVTRDTTWEADETFTVVLNPDPGSAIPGAITQQLVTVRSNIAAKSGELAFTGFGPGNERVSTRGINVAEGETVRLWIGRTGGSDTEVAAQFAWSSGGDGFEVDPLVWGHSEDGLQFVDVTVPFVPGYQGSVAVLLTMTSPDTEVSRRYGTVRFNVADSEFGESVRDYVRANPGALPYIARGDDWFYPSNAEGRPCLRSKTPAQVGDSADLSFTVDGPGVLTFNAGIADASGAGVGDGLYTITVGFRGEPVQIAAENPDLLAFVIPDGRQRVTLSFERTGATAAGDFAWLCNPAYVKLDEIAKISPLDGAVAPEGAQLLVWQDALAPLAGIDGLDTAYVVYAGTSRTAMTEVETIPVGVAGVAPAVIIDPEDISTEVNVTAGQTYYWRVDVLLDDGSGPMQVEGGISSFDVVPAGAPQFAVDPLEIETASWYRSLTADGSTVTVEMMLGMQSRIGPFGVDVEPGSAVSVRVIGGRLPRGVSAEVIEGSLYLTGTPAAAGDGFAVVQVSESTLGGNVSGTTLGIIYTVTPLPEKAYGTFKGVAVLHDPVRDRLVPVNANIAIRNNGQASGRLSAAGGGSYSFRTAGFDGTEFYQNGGYVQSAAVTDRNGATLFVVMTIDISDGLVFPLRVPVERGATPMHLAIQVDNNGTTGEIVEETIYRDIWGDRVVDPYLTGVLEAVEGYYTVSLPGSSDDTAPLTIGEEDVYGNGYLTLTVSSRGAVRVSGKLADGERFSASASLVVSGERAFLTVMDDPRSYDGGHFMATLEFLSDIPLGVSTLELEPSTRNLPLVAVTYWWVSYDPEATGVYGSGFERMAEDEIAGGYYSKNESLYDYFINAPDGFHASHDSWDLETVDLAVNARGNGFDLPAGGTPENPDYLSVRARLFTGILTVAFRDYAGVGTTYSTIRGEGVLTPYFQLVPWLSEVSGRAYVLEALENGEQGYQFDSSAPFVIAEDCGTCGD